MEVGRNFLRLSGKRFLNGLQKVLYTCPQEHFRKTQFLKEKLSFLSCSHIEPKNFGLLAKSLGQVYQNCILSVRNVTLRHLFSLRKIVLCRFWTLSHTLWAFWPIKLRRAHQNCFLRVLGKKLRKVVSLKRKLRFSNFRTLSEKFTAFCRKFSSGIVISAIFVSIETSGWTKISRKSFLKIFLTIKDVFYGFLAEGFPKRCKKCHPVVHRNFLGKRCFLKKAFFYVIFRHWA